MRELYNEGRVVGLSQYESYVRHMLAKDPTAKILNEQQWLSASLSSNISMVMRVPAGTQKGVHDFKLPEGCDLCGCSTIYASPFEGEVTFDEQGLWAVRVDDYGRLIDNVLEHCPVTPGEPENVPTKADPLTLGQYSQQCKEYLKVSGAMMFQPGEWDFNRFYEQVETESEIGVTTQDREELLAPLTDMIAAKALEPDLSRTGFIRLAISETITFDFLILFHGFSYKTLVSGEVGYAYVPDVGLPPDGGFLGPAVFPWGCRIVLVVSNEVLRSVMGGSSPIPTPIPDWVNEWAPSWDMYSEHVRTIGG